jgi:transcriptional regulator with PAS, ATPase and Fis domain
MAHGGHFFLDEIGELPERHQAHLLRVMDTDGAYHALGDATERKSNVRFIGATNRDLTTLKHDLLARFPHRIVVPPLRDRRSDIPFLIDDYLVRCIKKNRALVEPFLGSGAMLVEPRLIDALVRHPYTENTRELHRILEVALASSKGSFLQLTRAVVAEMEQRLARVAETSEAPAAKSAKVDIESYSREQIVAALIKAGTINGAAALLRVSRHALYRYMKRHAIAWERE